MCRFFFETVYTVDQTTQLLDGEGYDDTHKENSHAKPYVGLWRGMWQLSLWADQLLHSSIDGRGVDIFHWLSRWAWHGLFDGTHGNHWRLVDGGLRADFWRD